MYKKKFSKVGTSVHLGVNQDKLFGAQERYEKIRDIDRCGLFSDFGYLINDKYRSPPLCDRSVCRGKRFTLGVSHKKCGIPALSGYFDPVFRTINVNEKYTDKWKSEAPVYKSTKKWNIPSGVKLHSTPGDIYGTFNEKYQVLSPLLKPMPPREKGLKLFLTNPPRKGGPGYVDTTIGPYPKHLSEKYNVPKEHFQKPRLMVLSSFSRPYFNENPFKLSKPIPKQPKKKLQLSKRNPIFKPSRFGDCFNKFPSWKPDKYQLPIKRTRFDKKYTPNGQTKSFYTFSIIRKKLQSACNETNYRTLDPITYSL